VSLRSGIKSVASTLSLLYAEYPVEEKNGFSDYHIRLDPPKNIRAIYKPQVRFYFDDKEPFKPLPLAHAFPLFEWGLNWCIAKYSHQFLIFHSAVLEKNGKAIVFPGEPGAGKSTLCAAMMLRGWRLLSDEMALVSPEDLRVTPVPRPVALKNESIEIIKAFDVNAIIGPKSYDTSKGTVAHLKAGDSCVARSNEKADVFMIVMPQFKKGSMIEFSKIPKSEMMNNLIRNSFNYNVLRESGFDTASCLLDTSKCYGLEYSDLDEVIGHLDKLVESNPA